MGLKSEPKHVKRRGESGQFLILFVLALGVLCGFVALTIDVGLFRHEQQNVQNAMDAAALAGAQELPDDAAAAEALALQFAQANDSGIATADVDISLRCIVGDRNGDGQPDASDIPAICDPGGSGSFTCNDGRCVSDCSPGDKCNTIVVGASKDVPFYFAPVLSVLGGPDQCFYSQCSTGAIRAAACSGACGGPPTVPLDVVIIIDRTGSMSSSELNNAKDAAMAVLELYNPNLQHVALGILGASDPNDLCKDEKPEDGGIWVPVPLSDDYQNADGSLNTGSLLVQTIDCLDSSSQGTNLGEPVKMAKVHLLTNGRPDVKKAIILLTDGAANRPQGNNPCLYAHGQANQAKASEIELFTIGFGIEGEGCEKDQSLWKDVLVTELLADMATDSLDDQGHCDGSAAVDAENADGDHFLCEAKSGDLEPIFKQVAETLAKGSRLVPVPN